MLATEHRAAPGYAQRVRVLVGICLFLRVLACQADVALVDDWTGRWNTLWASGTVQLTLVQDGKLVSGNYQPGGGKIDGWLVGNLFKGRWSQDGADGQFVFAMSRDGNTFAGRYDGDNYWNGMRVAGSDSAASSYASTGTPQATLTTLIDGMNATAAGDIGATLVWDKLLSYQGTTTDARNLRKRRDLLWRIIDLSTFKLLNAPSGALVARDAGVTATVVRSAGAAAGLDNIDMRTTCQFEIGPAGSQERYALLFQKDQDGRWLLVVEPAGRLQTVLSRFLDSLETESYETRLLERQQSPREIMRRFLSATNSWNDQSRDAAISTLDLGFLPESLQKLEAPLYVDYLRQVLHRIGGIHWQEIPDNPKQLQPYVHYRHPAGSLVIEPSVVQDGQTRWHFSSNTLKTVDDIYDAMQQLPLVSGVASVAPVSEFFLLRERFAGLSTDLIKRSLLLENWQWIALVVVLAIAILAAMVLEWLFNLIIRQFVDPQIADPENKALRSDNPAIRSRPLKTPVRLSVIGLACFYAIGKLGLPDETAIVMGRVAAIAAALGIGMLALRAIRLIGKHFTRQASQTQSYVDEIVASLVMGLFNLLVIVTTFIVMADIIGLPYEGVVAGLGVGGIAFAIAARETVSNFIGAATLLADRPFKRGDVVETAGIRARVLDVGLRSTKLRQHDDSIMMVPNAMLANEIISNRGVRKRRQIFLTIGLTYDTPREKLDEFVNNLRETWIAQERADKQEHYIGLKKFGASSIDIVFWGYALVRNRAEQFEAEHAFMGEIVDCARRTGVEFAFPTRTVHMVQQNELSA